jgi:hypothetical protein
VSTSCFDNFLWRKYQTNFDYDYFDRDYVHTRPRQLSVSGCRSPPSRAAHFIGDESFGLMALINTNILTALIRPPNLVLCFFAVGHPRCLPSPSPPPLNVALIIWPRVGRAPNPSLKLYIFSSGMSFKGNYACVPLRWCASSNRSSGSLLVAFSLSVVEQAKVLPWKRLGLRCFYSRA